jgi:hypothetical protein
MSLLQQIQSRLKAPKSQVNEFGGFKYRSLEDILESAKPILEELECSIVIGDEIRQLGDRYYVVAEASLYGPDMTLVKSTKAYAREPLSKKGMDEAQVTGATSSYARKYAVNGLLAIDDTKDPDTQDNSKAVSDKQVKQPDTQKVTNQKKQPPPPIKQPTADEIYDLIWTKNTVKELMALYKEKKLIINGWPEEDKTRVMNAFTECKLDLMPKEVQDAIAFLNTAKPEQLNEFMDALRPQLEKMPEADRKYVEDYYLKLKGGSK